MSSDLFAARSALFASADLWDAGAHDEAELASIRTLHLGKQLALELTQTAFDVCGARAAFKSTRARAPVPRRAHLLTALPRRAVHGAGRPGDARPRRSMPRATRARRRSPTRAPEPSGGARPASPRSAISSPISAPRVARLEISIRSPRAHESWQTGPSPSSVGSAERGRERARPSRPARRPAHTGMPQPGGVLDRARTQPRRRRARKRRPRDAAAQRERHLAGRRGGEHRLDPRQQLVAGGRGRRPQIDQQLGVVGHDLAGDAAAEHPDGHQPPLARGG